METIRERVIKVVSSSPDTVDAAYKAIEDYEAAWCAEKGVYQPEAQAFFAAGLIVGFRLAVRGDIPDYFRREHGQVSDREA